MLKLKNYILLIILLVTSVSVSAQRPTVRATIEPSDILIGEQAVINLEVISPLGRHVTFPIYNFADTIVKGVEVLSMSPIDSTMTEVMTLNQKYIITSFDSTLYHIPYLQVIVDGDTLQSNNFGLKVTAPLLSDTTLAYLEKLKNNEVDSIDFVQLQLADIKDIQTPPFVWQDYLIYLLMPILSLLVLLLIGLILYLWLKKKTKGYYFRPKVVIPPHIVAFDSLAKLKDKKLSQRGMEKVYHTELTDILRLYISDRYPNIQAQEMLTDEILRSVQQTTDASKEREELAQILQLADLVKFAKYVPLPDENDLSMTNAYRFVNETKEEEVTTEEGATPKAKSTAPTAKSVAPATKQQVAPSEPTKNEGDNQETTK